MENNVQDGAGGAVKSKEKANLALIGAIPMAGGLVPRTLEEAMNLSKVLSESALLPMHLRGKPADVLVTMLKGMELGLKPMHAFAEIFLIEGRPGCSAALKRALCLTSSVCEYFQMVESTAEKCTYVAKRRGNAEPSRFTYTIKDAERASLLGRGPWKAHPAAMLRARCSGGLADAEFADVVQGLKTNDELQEVHGEVVDMKVNRPPFGDTTAPKQETVRVEVPAEPTDDDGTFEAVAAEADGEPSEADQLHALIDEAESHERLKKLSAGVAAVKDRTANTELQQHWTRRWNDLKKGAVK